MKIPGEILGAQVRQVLFPGTVLALGVHPFLAGWLERPLEALYGLPKGTLLPVEILLFGLVLSSASRPLIYLYEGFYLPALSAWARPRNEAKVRAWKKELDALRTIDEMERTPQQQIRASLLTQYLSDYPIRTPGDELAVEVERPTLLGNVIACYELYPESRYGIDAVTFWHHLVHLAPASARLGFQGAVGLLEALILTSAAGAGVAAVGVMALAGFAIGERWAAFAAQAGAAWPEAPPLVTAVGARFAVLAVLAGAAVFYLFYRLAVPAAREAGVNFRAVTDLAVHPFEEWLGKLPAKPREALGPRAEQVRWYLNFLYGELPAPPPAHGRGLDRKRLGRRYGPC